MPDKKGAKKTIKIQEIITRDLEIAIIFVLILIALAIYLIAFKSYNVKSCGDGSVYEECSLRKPYYCSDGKLVERASICGCPEALIIMGDFCFSEYQSESKEVTLKYVLRAEEKEINFIAYKGLSNYLSSLPQNIYYSGNETPSRKDFKLMKINEPLQKELLLPLVVEIQNLAPNDKEEQMRIAVSIVQNIPFGNSNKTIKFFNVELNYSRYPYEVLYDMQGVCGEKSELLAFLLRELGYGTAIFHYKSENHESVGIKCQDKYGLEDSGYCFVETGGPSIITDNKIKYIGGIKLKSEPEIILISEGESLPENMYEYDDAEDWSKIREFINENGEINIFGYFKWKNLIRKYGLVEKYNI